MTEDWGHEVYEEVDNPLVWSVSRLRTIEGCGRQYKYRYIDRAEGVQTPYLAFGKAVHKMIEMIHQANDFSDWWEEAWSDLWWDHAADVIWEGFYKGAFDILGPKMIRKYVAANSNVTIIELETAFPTEGEVYKIGEFIVRGVLDQVRRTDAGKLLVVDLKTSKYPPDPLILRFDPQFTIYHHVAREKYKEEPLLALYHLESGKMYYTTRTDEDIKGVEAMLRQGQMKVDEEMYQRNIGIGCRYCPYLKECLTPNESINI